MITAKRLAACLAIIGCLGSAGSFGEATPAVEAGGQIAIPDPIYILSMIRYNGPEGDWERSDRRAMNKFTLIIDRFEGTWAVVEYEGETFDLPRSLLPEDAKEGDTLTLSLQVEAEDTEARRKRIERLMDDLFI
jgi:hypothetical protein